METIVLEMMKEQYNHLLEKTAFNWGRGRRYHHRLELKMVSEYVRPRMGVRPRKAAPSPDPQSDGEVIEENNFTIEAPVSCEEDEPAMEWQVEEYCPVPPLFSQVVSEGEEEMEAEEEGADLIVLFGGHLFNAKLRFSIFSLEADPSDTESACEGA